MPAFYVERYHSQNFDLICEDCGGGFRQEYFTRSYPLRPHLCYTCYLKKQEITVEVCITLVDPK